MRATGKLIAERALASHCPELLQRGPSQADLTAQLDAALPGLCRVLAGRLTPLCGQAAPAVTASPARIGQADELGAICPALVAAARLACGVAIAVDGGAVLRMLDLTFGGRGDVPETLPGAFPGSADMLIARLHDLLAVTLGEALRLTPGRSAVADRAAQVCGFEPALSAVPAALLSFRVAEAGGAQWQFHAALPVALLAEQLAAPAGTRARRRRTEAVNPLDEPFGAVPLNLSAVLVDMHVPMAAIMRLEPGTVLPVAVARKVPLRLGETMIAAGSVGAADDRVAIQISETSL